MQVACLQKGYSMKKIVLALGVILFGGATYWTMRPDAFDTGAPLLAQGKAVHLLEGLNTDTLPEGWVHRTFFRIPATEYQMTKEDATPVLRCSTDKAASILARDTLIALADLPMLSWRWKVTQPIESDIDEATEHGDDHPLRLYLRFTNEAGETRGSEIIWSNRKYKPGDYKVIGSFYHYVANGLNANLNVWHEHSIDLRQLYRDIGGTGAPTLTVLGVFCDSDNTGGKSDGMFSDITLSADTGQN